MGIPRNLSSGSCATAFFVFCQRLAGRRAAGPAASGQRRPALLRLRMPAHESRLPIRGTSGYRRGGRYLTAGWLVDATCGNPGCGGRGVDRRFPIRQRGHPGRIGHPGVDTGDDRAGRLVRGCQAVWEKAHFIAGALVFMNPPKVAAQAGGIEPVAGNSK
jgi:hypothetical protein